MLLSVNTGGAWSDQEAALQGSLRNFSPTGVYRKSQARPVANDASRRAQY